MYFSRRKSCSLFDDIFKTDVIQIIVFITFGLVFWRVFGLRLWSHAYIGVPYIPSKPTYYLEFLTLCLTLFLFLLRPSVPLKEAKKHWTIFVFLAYVFVVTVVPWSNNRTSLSVMLEYWEIIIGISFAFKYFGPDGVYKYLFYLCVAYVILNLVSIALPSQSFMLGEHAGKFRGLASHKNTLAEGLLFCLYIFLCSPRYLATIKIQYAFLVLVVAMLIIAQSAQGVMLCLLGFVIYYMQFFKKVFRHPYTLISILLFIVVLTVEVTSLSLDGFLALFGRDATFTGRDKIWELAIYLIQKMPFEGYGIGAIGSQSDVVSKALLLSYGLGSVFGTAHNSYIDALLSLGWMGAVIFYCMVIYSFSSILYKYFAKDSKLQILSMLLITFCIFGGFTASEKLFLANTGSIGWFCFVMANFLSKSKESI